MTTLAVLDVADSPRAAHDEGRLADKVCGHRAFEVQLEHALVHGLSPMQGALNVNQPVVFLLNPGLQTRILKRCIEGITDAFCSRSTLQNGRWPM